MNSLRMQKGFRQKSLMNYYFLSKMAREEQQMCVHINVIVFLFTMCQKAPVWPFFKHTPMLDLCGEIALNSINQVRSFCYLKSKYLFLILSLL